MMTKEEIRNYLEKNVIRVLVPPPIDDFENAHFRRMTIEFTRSHDNYRFLAKSLIEQPYHYEDQSYTKASGVVEHYDIKQYDPWDEQDWVERGKQQMLDDYASQMYYAQRHLAFMNVDSHE